jgi:hypothetical protein
MEELKTQMAARQADLDEQTRKAADIQRAGQLADAQKKLAVDLQSADQAKKSYDTASAEYDQQAAIRDKAAAAQVQVLKLSDTLANRTALLGIAVHDRDEKQAAAEGGFDIAPLTDSSIETTTTSHRKDYSLYAVVAISLFFAFLTLANSHRAAGPPNEPRPPRRSGLPLDPLSIPSPAHNGNGSGNGHGDDDHEALTV